MEELNELLLRDFRRVVEKRAKKSAREEVPAAPQWATVTLVAEDGRPTVAIDGGETAQCDSWAASSHVGDRVRVLIEKHKLRLVENHTVAAVNDADYQHVKDVSEQAQELVDVIASVADEASKTKEQVISDAAAAGEGVEQIKTYVGYAEGYNKTLAEKVDEGEGLLADMQQAATEAGTTLTAIYADATEAKTQASEAKTAATTANTYANIALRNLSTVEDVVDALAWIQRHGYMKPTSDEVLNPAHVYYLPTEGGNVVVGSVQDAEANVVAGETHFSQVTEPNEDDLATYFELSISESVNNYIVNHVSVDGEGMWLAPEDKEHGYRVLVSTGAGSAYTDPGTYIIDSKSNVVAKYGTDVVVGDERGFHIEITGERLAFCFGRGESRAVAWISSDETGSMLHIDKAVIVKELHFGNWAFIPRSNNNLSLKWVG